MDTKSIRSTEDTESENMVHIKEKKGILLHILAWILGAFILLVIAGKILMPKFLASLETFSPETEMWRAFYKEPQNSIDVMFVGSSHVYQGINPLVFTEETGETAFDLCSSSQDNATGYFFVKEALRYQKPKYIFLDVGFLWLDSFAGTDRVPRAVDYMRWSSVKNEAVDLWLEINQEQRKINRIFPVLDYHTRWRELQRTDFYYTDKIVCEKGFIPTYSAAEVRPLDMKKDYTPFEMDDVSAEYFDKLVSLCKDNDITLVLICVPFKDWNCGKADTVRAIAEKYGLVYVDYTDEENYERIGLDDATDWYNYDHLNALGADKMSKTIAGDFNKCLFAQ